jgi:hypothetical protein
MKKEGKLLFQLPGGNNKKFISRLLKEISDSDSLAAHFSVESIVKDERGIDRVLVLKKIK